MSYTNRLEDRLRHLFVAFLSIIIIGSTIAFKLIEKRSWLDSLYFVVSTISTVGYGDVVAKHPITKSIVILLIISGILSIGVLTQFFFQRLLQFQLNRRVTLPSKPIPYRHHIIIGGYGSKGRKIAQLFKDRLYPVIIIETNDERAKLAEFNEFEVIRGDITKPSVLKILSLEHAAGLFLCLNNDNSTLQSSILARSYSIDLRIYAEINSLSTYNIARYAGIDRPISQVNFLANVIRSHLYHFKIQPFFTEKELISQESSIGVVQVLMQNTEDWLTTVGFPLGYYSHALNEFYLGVSETAIRKNFPADDSIHFLYALERDLLREIDRDLLERTPHKRIIFAGYGDFIESILERIDITDETEIIVIYENQNDKEIFRDSGYTIIEWEINDAPTLLENLIQLEDLVICSFNDITNSLFLAVSLQNLQRKTHLIQLVPYEFDIEPFVKVGADAVITPQLIISNAMISTFMQDNQLPPSIIFTNGHLFEYVVESRDRLWRKKVAKLETEGFYILYIMKSGKIHFETASASDYLQTGDRLLVWVNHGTKFSE